MKRIGIVVWLAVSVMADSAESQSVPVVGERHEIILSYETSNQSSDGSSGSSSGRDAMLERVITVRDSGLELEFDLPLDATAEDRARVWQYPARVFQPTTGEMILLNGGELEGRVEDWLAAADMTREMCGRWIFTWNAFRIECDPASVIAGIDAIDLRREDLREGAPYRHPLALGSAPLHRTTHGADGSTYSVILEADAEVIRRSRAQNDVAIGEMIGQPISLESALRERSKEAITGTVEITFDVDPAGNPIRRSVVTTLVTVKPDGVSETDRQRATTERRRIS